MKRRPGVIAVLAAVPSLIDGGATTWIQVMKTGSFYDPRYGDFTITVEDMAGMVRNFEASPTGVPGDYDHSFVTDGDTRACGWTSALEIRGTELWAQVEFTPQAADAIRAGEYRFISPEFTFARINERGENVGPCLMAWGLTNRPFLEGMAEVTLAVAGDGRTIWCSPDTTTKERSMDPKELRKRLGLGEDTTDEQVLARAGELLTLAQPRPDAVVLTQSDVNELKERAAAGDAAVKALHQHTRDAVIDKAVRDGKIPPAVRDAMALAYDADPAGVTKAVEEMAANPAFLSLGQGAAPAPTGDDPTEHISVRIERRALALQQATPGLSYEHALMQADREVRPVEVTR